MDGDFAPPNTPIVPMDSVYRKPGPRTRNPIVTAIIANRKTAKLDIERQTAANKAAEIELESAKLAERKALADDVRSQRRDGLSPEEGAEIAGQIARSTRTFASIRLQAIETAGRIGGWLKSPVRPEKSGDDLSAARELLRAARTGVSDHDPDAETPAERI